MRRRRYWNKVVPLRLTHPRMIECFGITRDGPVTVQISNERYDFCDDGHGRKIAPVYLVDHVDCFIARADMYRAVAESPAQRQLR